jgi:hypothetical protein
MRALVREEEAIRIQDSSWKEIKECSIVFFQATITTYNPLKDEHSC